MKDVNTIPNKVVEAARAYPRLRQHFETFLHYNSDPENNVPVTYEEFLENALVMLHSDNCNLQEILKLHCNITRKPDVLMLKNALVNETATVLERLGAALRIFRLKKGFSLADLAEKRGSRRSKDKLARMEAGKQNFQIATLLDVADKLGLQVSIAAIPKPDEENAEESEALYKPVL